MTTDQSHCQIRFLHRVGKATLCQGISVPVMAQKGWLLSIPKGGCQPVRIDFGESSTVTATLRRINNARGHLQFRYEGKDQAPLRDYLTCKFGAAKPRDWGILQIIETEHRPVLFHPSDWRPLG